MKCEKLGNHTISYQSLLLSTTVLNDSATKSKETRNKILGQENILA